MLAGLLFANENDEGAAGNGGGLGAPAPGLVAAMPFAGITVVEHQARLLLAAGVSHIVVFAQAPSVALRAATARLARRGVAVDLVVDARGAAEAFHPLSAILMLADGLVADEAVVAAAAAQEGETLLVVAADAAPAGLERVGGGDAWAGVARIAPRRVTELAELPRDYAPQSTLLRLVEAAGGARVALPAGGGIHAIVASAAALEAVERQRLMLAARPAPDWFSRYLLAPATRPAVPVLARAHVATGGVAAAAATAAVVALVLFGIDRFGWGALLLLLALWLAGVGTTLAALRDEGRLRRWLRHGVEAGGALAALVLAWRTDAVTGTNAAVPVALSVVVAAALVERSGAAPRRRWGGPAACIAIVAVTTLVGLPFAGLAVTAMYAATMLAIAVEALRRLAPP